MRRSPKTNRSVTSIACAIAAPSLPPWYAIATALAALLPSRLAVWSVGVEHLNSLEHDMEVIELDVEYVDDSAYPTTA